MMDVEFSELTGKTLVRCEQAEYLGEDSIEFETKSDGLYRMRHHQDCCESVYIEDICGDLQDLVGEPITMADEVISDEHPEGSDKDKDPYIESFTWTFYKLATVKGYVTIRWFGKSNGYYSEKVSFEKVG